MLKKRVVFRYQTSDIPSLGASYEEEEEWLIKSD